MLILQCIANEYPPGYPRLAAHIDSETNTHLYRRFGYLRTRSLLYLQDELICLERRLRDMDVADSEEEPYRLVERSFDVEDDPKRQALFVQINAKLREYDEMILRQKEMLALRPVSRRDWRYYARYLWGKKPLSREDMEFVWLRSDMIDLYTYAESSWIKPMVNAVMPLIPQRLTMVWFANNGKKSNMLKIYTVHLPQETTEAEAGKWRRGGYRSRNAFSRRWKIRNCIQDNRRLIECRSPPRSRSAAIPTQCERMVETGHYFHIYCHVHHGHTVHDAGEKERGVCLCCNVSWFFPYLL